MRNRRYLRGCLKTSLFKIKYLLILGLLSSGYMLPAQAARVVTDQIPLYFESNQGQTDLAVRFLARGPGYGLFLTPNEAVLRLQRGKPTGSTARGKPAESSSPTGPAVLRLSLTGETVNPTPTLAGQDGLSGKSHYFRGKNPAHWQTDVSHYGRVVYQQVYPGIDWVLYGNPHHLAYDFVVAPGGDPGQIQLRFSGAESVTLDQHGQLLLKFESGEVVQPPPVIYQLHDGERQFIKGGYVVDPDRECAPQVRFQVAAYDRDQPLVIDPTLVYSTYLGGSGYDYGWQIAVDGTGRAYVSGRTSSLDFPTTANAPQGSFGGGTGFGDAFVARLSAAGDALEYATYLGGSDDDFAIGITVDSAGRAYVTGGTASSDFPTTANALQSAFGGRGGGSISSFGDAFIVRLSAAGDALDYSTYLGGSGAERGAQIALDDVGRVYVTGTTNSADFPTTSNALQVTYGGGGGDIFVARLNAAGNALEYSTYLGGNDFDRNANTVVDSTGRVYVVIVRGNFPNRDSVVARLSAAGDVLEYVAPLGGSGDDAAWRIAVDGTSRAYVIGQTDSPDFPITADALQGALGGSSDAFVVRLSAGGAREYSTYLGGSGDDFGGGIAVDNTGRIYMAGGTSSTDFPITADALQGTLGGSSDVFVARLSAGGDTLEYSTYLGGSGGETMEGFKLDSNGHAYVTGFTTSLDFPTTANALQTAFSGGGGDAYVATIAGLIPLSVKIDIKPGSFPNSINLGSSGVIPVAILSSNGFNASTEVDPSSLSLAGAKVRVVGKTDKTLCHIEDVNGDNLPDLVCQFENELSSQVGDSTAVLEGSTFSGVPIRGEDTIRIVPNN